MTESIKPKSRHVYIRLTEPEYQCVIRLREHLGHSSVSETLRFLIDKGLLTLPPDVRKICHGQ